MWIFIILAIVTLIFMGITVFNSDDMVEGSLLSACVLLLGLCVIGAVGFPLSAATNGLFPDYSKGERVGYVVNTSIEGIIWKTNEVQM